jgi:hypothetical protein
MKILHHIRKYNRIRKTKDEILPQWKHSVNEFNEKHFRWLEKFVEYAIPWLVLLLLLILFAEFADDINKFNWQWMNSIAQLTAEYNYLIVILDRIIIAFFVIDLYFSFFKKAKLWTFLKHYCLDIIAIFPFGLFIAAETAAVRETQEAVHLLGGAEKEAARLPIMERLITNSAKIVRPAARASRVVRIYRLIDFFKHKKKKKQEDTEKKK